MLEDVPALGYSSDVIVKLLDLWVDMVEIVGLNLRLEAKHFRGHGWLMIMIHDDAVLHWDALSETNSGHTRVNKGWHYVNYVTATRKTWEAGLSYHVLPKASLAF